MVSPAAAAVIPCLEERTHVLSSIRGTNLTFSGTLSMSKYLLSRFM
jgi:hypothetical protein